MPSKLFRFTYFAKNTSATPLVSPTFKTQALKPFRFIHFQKSGGGGCAFTGHGTRATGPRLRLSTANWLGGPSASSASFAPSASYAIQSPASHRRKAKEHP